MDPSQKLLLDQAAEIVKQANTQSWTAGLVALMFVLMFALWILMVKWFQNSKSKADAEALTREQQLGAKIDRVEEFNRTTMVDLQTKSIEAMNNVAHAMRGCLARQRLDH